MRKTVKIFLGFMLWVGLAIYMLVAFPYSSRKSKQVLLDSLAITIVDSTDYQFVTSEQIHSLINSSSLKYKGVAAKEFNTKALDSVVLKNPFINKLTTYYDLSGVLHLSLSQRLPIMRFICQDGYNFYLTSDNYVLPYQNNFATHTPLVTGQVDFPFAVGFVGSIAKDKKENEKKDAKNCVFFYKLINFVKFISDDDFWNSQIVQINVLRARQSSGNKQNSASHLVELVPRAGNCVIMLGELDDFEKKLSKLLRLYQQSMPYEGWDNASYINLSYDAQIVVSK